LEDVQQRSVPHTRGVDGSDGRAPRGETGQPPSISASQVDQIQSIDSIVHFVIQFRRHKIAHCSIGRRTNRCKIISLDPAIQNENLKFRNFCKFSSPVSALQWTNYYLLAIH